MSSPSISPTKPQSMSIIPLDLETGASRSMNIGYSSTSRASAAWRRLCISRSMRSTASGPSWRSSACTISMKRLMCVPFDSGGTTTDISIFTMVDRSTPSGSVAVAG